MAKKPRNTDKTDRTLQATDLSRAYRSGADEQPPPHLDAVILAEARKAVSAPGPFSSRWSVPLSTAAVIVLSVVLVMFMAREAPLQERALLDSAPTDVVTAEPKAKADRQDKAQAPVSTFAPAPAPAEIQAEAKKESRAEAAPPAAPSVSAARERSNDSVLGSAAPSQRSERALAKQAAPTINLQVGNRTIRVEIASTSTELARGLMYRDTLAPDAGMLFIFSARESEVCMWMKDTTIPLSAAFIDRNGKVLNIAEMQPLSSAVHCAEGQARFVLEVNQETFTAAGVKRGSRIGGLPPLN